MFIYTQVDDFELSLLKETAKKLNINYERWIICDGEITHLDLNPGIAFYSKQYNCIRGTFDNTQKMLKFDDFIRIIVDGRV